MTSSLFTQQDMGGVPDRRPSLVFSVNGIPMPKGSVSAVIGPDGNAHIVHGARAKKRADGTRDTTRQKLFRAWVRDTIAAARAAMLLRPRVVHEREALELVIHFYLPRPPSLPKRVKYPNRPPDGDKLERCVWDCLKIAGAVHDDSRIIDWGGRKRYAVDRAPGAEIFVYEMD